MVSVTIYVVVSLLAFFSLTVVGSGHGQPYSRHVRAMAAYGRQPSQVLASMWMLVGVASLFGSLDRLSGCSAGQPAGGSEFNAMAAKASPMDSADLARLLVHAVDGRVARIPAVGCGHVHVGRVHPLAARQRRSIYHRGDSRHGSHRDTARLAVLGALGTWFDCHGGGAGIGVLRHGHATDARRPGGGADGLRTARCGPASSPRSACTSLSAC